MSRSDVVWLMLDGADRDDTRWRLYGCWSWERIARVHSEGER